MIFGLGGHVREPQNQLSSTLGPPNDYNKFKRNVEPFLKKYSWASQKHGTPKFENVEYGITISQKASN